VLVPGAAVTDTPIPRAALYPSSMSALTDTLAWVVIAAFLLAAVASTRNERVERYVTTGAWAVFAAFWLALVPHFAFVQRSIIEGALSALAVPLSLYVAYLVWQDRRNFRTLTRGVAFMGLVYLPFQTITILERTAIETTTRHVELFLAALGYTPPVVASDPEGYRSIFVFTAPDGHRFTTEVLLACTGIGSTAIVAGLVAAVKAPMKRRLQALAIAVPIIYALNVIRVAFIALAHGYQWFADWQTLAFTLFQTTNANMVSYLVADRVIAQSLSVFALIGLTLVLLRIVPELGSVVEDVLFVATGKEYDIERLYA